MSKSLFKKKKRKVRPRQSHSSGQSHLFDMPILLVTLLLLVIGVIAVFEASIIQAYNQFGDELFFAKRQLQWATIGFIVMMVTAYSPIEYTKKLAVPFFIVSLLLLVLVLIPGLGTKIGGATRWLDIGFFSFQPSEVSKLAIIFYFAALFEKSSKLVPFLGSLAITAGLIMLQPDLGTTIIISVVSIAIYFIAGAKWKEIVTIGVSGLTLGSILILSSPYRLARLMTFLDPNADPQGASYHIRQIIISLGSGGLVGTGIGRSLQKYRYLPEATTDSIFAVIGEETGFIGSIFIIGLFTMIAYRGLKIAQGLDDPFLRLTAVGLTVMIVSQAFLNLGAMGAIVPLTGITLPFISYGGSSLIVSLAAVGLLLNISRYTQVRHGKRKR